MFPSTIFFFLFVSHLHIQCKPLPQESSFEGYYYHHPVFENDESDTVHEEEEPPLLKYKEDPDPRLDEMNLCCLDNKEEYVKDEKQNYTRGIAFGDDAELDDAAKRHDNASLGKIVDVLKTLSLEQLSRLQTNLTKYLTDFDHASRAANDTNDLGKAISHLQQEYSYLASNVKVKNLSTAVDSKFATGVKEEHSLKSEHGRSEKTPFKLHPSKKISELLHQDGMETGSGDEEKGQPINKIEKFFEHLTANNSVKQISQLKISDFKAAGTYTKEDERAFATKILELLKIFNASLDDEASQQHTVSKSDMALFKNDSIDSYKTPEVSEKNGASEINSDDLTDKKTSAGNNANVTLKVTFQLNVDKLLKAAKDKNKEIISGLTSNNNTTATKGDVEPTDKIAEKLIESANDNDKIKSLGFQKSHSVPNEPAVKESSDEVFLNATSDTQFTKTPMDTMYEKLLQLTPNESSDGTDSSDHASDSVDHTESKNTQPSAKITDTSKDSATKNAEPSIFVTAIENHHASSNSSKTTHPANKEPINSIQTLPQKESKDKLFDALEAIDAKDAIEEENIDKNPRNDPSSKLSDSYVDMIRKIQHANSIDANKTNDFSSFIMKKIVNVLSRKVNNISDTNGYTPFWDSYDKKNKSEIYSSMGEFLKTLKVLAADKYGGNQGIDDYLTVNKYDNQFGNGDSQASKTKNPSLFPSSSESEEILESVKNEFAKGVSIDNPKNESSQSLGEDSDDYSMSKLKEFLKAWHPGGAQNKQLAVVDEVEKEGNPSKATESKENASNQSATNTASSKEAPSTQSEEDRSLAKFNRLVDLLKANESMANATNWKDNTYLHLSIGRFEELFKNLLPQQGKSHAKPVMTAYRNEDLKDIQNIKPPKSTNHNKTVDVAKHVGRENVHNLTTITDKDPCITKFQKLLKLLTFKEMLKHFSHSKDEDESANIKLGSAFLGKVETLLKLLAFNRIFEDWNGGKSLDPAFAEAAANVASSMSNKHEPPESQIFIRSSKPKFRSTIAKYRAIKRTKPDGWCHF